MTTSPSLNRPVGTSHGVFFYQALGIRRGLFRLKTMQKIKDFETFAAGYFLGLGIKKPTAEDICRLSVECRAFAAALSFYMFTDPYVLSKLRTPEKYEAVAKNIERFIQALP